MREVRSGESYRPWHKTEFDGVFFVSDDDKLGNWEKSKENLVRKFLVIWKYLVWHKNSLFPFSGQFEEKVNFMKLQKGKITFFKNGDKAQ